MGDGKSMFLVAAGFVTHTNSQCGLSYIWGSHFGMLGDTILEMVLGRFGWRLGAPVEGWKKEVSAKPSGPSDQRQGKGKRSKTIEPGRSTEPRAKTADHDKNNEGQLLITKNQAKGNARDTKGQLGISLYIKIFFNSR